MFTPNIQHVSQIFMKENKQHVPFVMLFQALDMEPLKSLDPSQRLAQDAKLGSAAEIWTDNPAPKRPTDQKKQTLNISRKIKTADRHNEIQINYKFTDFKTIIIKPTQYLTKLSM